MLTSRSPEETGSVSSKLPLSNVVVAEGAVEEEVMETEEEEVEDEESLDFLVEDILCFIEYEDAGLEKVELVALW